MMRHSPHDNVKPVNYPAMLVQVSLNDSQVPYWEGTKLVAKLRATKTDKNTLLLKANMGAGHGGSSGRYDALRETAFTYAFMLWQMGVPVAGTATSSGGSAGRRRPRPPLPTVRPRRSRRGTAFTGVVMITGAHSIIYSTNPDADRAVLRDVFKLTHVDVGGGWLIFGCLRPRSPCIRRTRTACTNSI